MIKKIYLSKKKEIFFLFFFLICYLLTFYNFFSVNFFFWDDKDVIFRIEEIGHKAYIFDTNFSPRFFKQVFHSTFYNLFEYNYKLYKLTFIFFNFISSIIFYFFIKKVFSNDNLALLSLLLFATFTSIDVFNTSIIILPNAISLTLYLFSFFLTIFYVQTKSISKKILNLILILSICIVVNLLHFPYFYFSELARLLLIIYLLNKNSEISFKYFKNLKKILYYFFPFFIFLILFIIWILFFETNFLGRDKPPQDDYNAKSFLLNFLHNPFNYFFDVSKISFANLINLILSPIELFFQSLQLINDGTKSFYSNFFLKYFLSIFIIVYFGLHILDKYFGILEINFSKKKLMTNLLFSLLLITFMMLFSAIAFRIVTFDYTGGFSRYALPGYVFLGLFYIFLIRFIFFDKKTFLIIFSLLLSFQMCNGYLTSSVYDLFENDKKKQFQQITWRFDNFPEPTEIIIEDDKYAANTTLMLDKDHFLLSLIYDKSKEFINIRRFKLNEPKILIENYYTNIDSISKIKKNYVVAFKTKYSECYEFFDKNTYKYHPRYFYMKNFKGYNVLGVEKPKYEFFKYYKNLNKMKIYNEDDKRGQCYFYQIAKKNLIENSFDDLSYITRQFKKHHAYETLHEKESEYDYFILKPFYISMLKEGGLENIKSLKKSLDWYQPHRNLKILILCDSIGYLDQNKLDYNRELNNLCI